MKCEAASWNPGTLTDRHDWVLVASPANDPRVQGGVRLLWACPCGEFRWTSYAEWEGRERREDIEDMAAASLEGLEQWEAEHGFGQIEPAKEHR